MVHSRTDYALAVGALYAYHETWGEVAYHLEQSGSKHPRAYWHGIAYGRIENAAREAKAAITRACQAIGLPVTTVTRNGEPRKNISYSLQVYKRMKALKNRHSATWDELGQMMLDKMEGL